MKATEFRLILLYIGPLIFKGLLDNDVFEHFLLLHASMRILCCPSLSKKYRNTAKLYLQKEFDGFISIYGLQSAILNVHNILHIVDMKI